MGIVDSTESIDGATNLDDESGLKIQISTREELYKEEAKNILTPYIKYLSGDILSKKDAPFNYAWFIQLHNEMFSDVWDWAGKLRKNELSIGIKAYQVSTELKKLCDDLTTWEKYQTFNVIEIATRLHHRAVQIHPFQNGNGRWSRLIANIYLKQNGKKPIAWNETSLSNLTITRDKYISALREADNGNYKSLIEMHYINNSEEKTV